MKTENSSTLTTKEKFGKAGDEAPPGGEDVAEELLALGDPEEGEEDVYDPAQRGARALVLRRGRGSVSAMSV